MATPEKLPEPIDRLKTRLTTEPDKDVSKVDVDDAYRNLEETGKEAREELDGIIRKYLLEQKKTVETEGVIALKQLQLKIHKMQTRTTVAAVTDKAIDYAQDARLHIADAQKQYQVLGFAMPALAVLGLLKLKNWVIDPPMQAARWTGKKGLRVVKGAKDGVVGAGSWMKRHTWKLLAALGIVSAVGIGGYGVYKEAQKEKAADPTKDPEIGAFPNSAKENIWSKEDHTVKLPVRAGRVWVTTFVDGKAITPTPADGSGLIDLKTIPGQTPDSVKDIKQISVKHILAKPTADGSLAESGTVTINKPS